MNACARTELWTKDLTAGCSALPTAKAQSFLGVTTGPSHDAALALERLFPGRLWSALAPGPATSAPKRSSFWSEH